MRFFNILLQSDLKRVENSQKLKENIPNLEIFPAIEGKTNQLEFMLEDREIHTELLKFCKRGALACLLSHLNVWKKMVKENIKEAVILEDDAVISNDFLEKFYSIYNEFSQFLKPADFVYLFVHPYSKAKCENLTQISENLMKGYKIYGLVAYYITLNTAKDLIEILKTNINDFIDNTVGYYLEKNNKNYYCVVENLVETKGKLFQHQNTNENTNGHNNRYELFSTIGETEKFSDPNTEIQFTYFLDEDEYKCYPCCDLEEDLFYDETIDLKNKYLNNENVVAFNSDGWIKKFPSKWKINLNTCLYLKKKKY